MFFIEEWSERDGDDWFEWIWECNLCSWVDLKINFVDDLIDVTNKK